MGKRILVLLGHTDPQSFCAALAANFSAAAQGAGHQVRRFGLDQAHFDPLLRAGYRQPQALEPDLERLRAELLWAEHLVIVFPLWWGGLPAALKGLFDRLLLPGFAFRYISGKARPEPLLTGRTAELMVTMDTPPWYYRLVDRDAGIRQLRVNILEFCGIRVRHVWRIGPLISSTPAQREHWLAQAAERGGRLGGGKGAVEPGVEAG